MGTTSSGQYPFQVTSLRCAAGTDVGMRREENQDSFGVIRGDGFQAYFVADGMGGAKGGATASRMAISSLQEILSKPGVRITPNEVAAIVQRVNRKIFEKGSGEPEFAGMGTTLVGLIFTKEGVLEVNVGDSRAYRVRGNSIVQISEDHTVVRELVRSGAISADEAEDHPVSHLLTRSLGPVADVEVECRTLSEVPVVGDIYVLCSDGLYNFVPAEDICSVVSQTPLDDANQILINLANQRGGSDNITALVIAVGEQNARERSVPQVPAAFQNAMKIEDRLQGREREVASESEPSGPPMVEEPKDTRAQRKPVRVQSDKSPGMFTRFSSATILAGVLFFGLFVGAFAKGYLPWLDSIDKRRPGAGVPSNRADLDREGMGNPMLWDGQGESPLSELARQIRGEQVESATGQNTSSLAKLRAREEVELSVRRLQERLDALSASQPIDMNEALNAARLRLSILQRDYDAMTATLDAGSRAVTMWLGRQVKFEGENNVEAEKELEKVGAYSESVKEKAAAITALSYQYAEKADKVELHPHDDSLRLEMESISKKREQLRRELRDEVRKVVGIYLAKSYTAYETVKARQDALWGDLQLAKREVEVLSDESASDVVKRDALRELVNVRLIAERRALADLEKSRAPNSR